MLLRQCKIDIHRIERLQRNNLLPGVDHLPDVHLADPELSSNGARTSFFTIIARMLSTVPCFCLNFDSALSSSAFEMTLRVARSWERCKSARANSKSASAVRNCASSEDASSFTNTSPCLATLPFGNLISATVPPSSVETTAPCTAEIDPTDESIGDQSSSFTGALDTVVGGIIIGADFILRICSALIPTIMSNTTTSPSTALDRAFRVDFTLSFFISVWATSCIRWFG